MQFDWLSIIWIVLALVLPISALVGRRLEWRKGIVMALGWAAILAITATFITAIRG